MLNLHFRYFRPFVCIVALSFLVHVSMGTIRANEKEKRPGVGDVAANFELDSLGEKKIQLAKLTEAGPVVIIVLRGYPGYQCPVCSVQVGQFLAKAESFQKAKAQVVLIYPGPAEGLKAHSEEFVSGKALPQNFHLVLDPDYTFAKSWNLRWDAKNETTYPSTFVVDSKGKIQFAKISMTHGGRAGVDEVLKSLVK